MDERGAAGRPALDEGRPPLTGRPSERAMPSRRAARTPGTRSSRPAPRARRPNIEETDPLDAEDIALARLQAELRKTEAMPAPPRAAARGRTTIRLPDAMLERLRARARRDHTTLSQVIEAALERHLKSA